MSTAAHWDSVVLSVDDLSHHACPIASHMLFQSWPLACHSTQFSVQLVPSAESPNVWLDEMQVRLTYAFCTLPIPLTDCVAGAIPLIPTPRHAVLGGVQP